MTYYHTMAYVTTEVKIFAQGAPVNIMSVCIFQSWNESILREVRQCTQKKYMSCNKNFKVLAVDLFKRNIMT